MEIDISNLSPDKLIRIINYNENISYKEIFSSSIPLLNIYLIKEFTPKDKVFTTLGNECIYKLFSDMHDFYTKDSIELPISTTNRNSTSTIPNFYRYFLIQILNMINSLKTPDGINYLSDKLDDDDDSMMETINKYYRIKKARTIQMISEDELDANRAFIYYEGEADLDAQGNPKDETLTILEPILKNNNVFITVGKEIVMILNKFPEDALKTKYIPPQKRQLEQFFKFTAWVLSKEYIKKCLEILDSKQGSLVKIDNILKDRTIFHITSLHNYDINELNAHVDAHKQYIKDFIISKDKYLCKSYNPNLLINPFSDISSSLLHIHIRQEILHLDPLKLINYKTELLKSKKSIYDTYTNNSISSNKLINGLKIDKFNFKNINPYIPSIKMSSLFVLE